MSANGQQNGDPKKDVDLMKALRLVVQRAGGPKRVAAALWPSLKLSTAHHRLLSCLDPRRRERFSPEELIFMLRLGRDMADHSAMELFATLSGYSKPFAITLGDEKADLERRVLQAIEESKPVMARMEELTRQHKARRER